MLSNTIIAAKKHKHELKRKLKRKKLHIAKLGYKAFTRRRGTEKQKDNAILKEVVARAAERSVKRNEISL